jgi:hypothetical protein
MSGQTLARKFDSKKLIWTTVVPDTGAKAWQKRTMTKAHMFNSALYQKAGCVDLKRANSDTTFGEIFEQKRKYWWRFGAREAKCEWFMRWNMDGLRGGAARR